MKYDEFDMELVEKIDRGEKLSEKELKAMAFECNEIDLIEGGNRRWTKSVTSIIELCGRYFAVEWEEGLTEYQKNEFLNQPYEVEKHTYEKTITITEWKRKEKI